MERKTHHEPWILNKSVKERFDVASENIIPFLTGRKKWEDVALKTDRRTAAQLGREKAVADTMQETILKEGLRPFMRVTYHREAFQTTTNNDVRMTLDSCLEYTPVSHLCEWSIFFSSLF